MDPKKSRPAGGFVATLKIMSQHSCHLCSLNFFVACDFLSRYSLLPSSGNMSRQTLKISRQSSAEVVL